MAENRSVRELTKVSPGTPNASVAKLGQEVAEQLKLKAHAGQLYPSHPLYDAELTLCINSYIALAELELPEGELIDEFYDITERIYDWADTHQISLS